MSEFNEMNRSAYVNGELSLKDYMTRVYLKMGGGLLVTAVVAALGYFTGFWYNFLMATGTIGYLLLVVAQFGIVIALSSKITTMNPQTASILFYAYAALTGMTFSTLFMAYGIDTVFASFAFTAVLFFSMAVIGRYTKVDITKFSGILMGGLIALFVASIVSMFIPAIRNSLVISYLGIILFLGITAWDSQRISSFYYATNNGYGTAGANLAVYGALELYLDFINIFLYVIRIVAGNRSRRN